MFFHNVEKHFFQYCWVYRRRITAVFLVLRTLDIGQNGAGNKLGFMSSLLFQQL